MRFPSRLRPLTAMTFPLSNFAAPAGGIGGAAPWPIGPILDLPAGTLEVVCGTVITWRCWVLAVALSPKHLVVSARAPALEACPAILEQSVGFWFGRDAAIVRIPLRCEANWFRDSTSGKTLISRSVLFWARSYFAAAPCQRAELPSNIWPVVPLSSILGPGSRYWTDAGIVLAGLEAYGSDMIYEIAPIITNQARRWEYHMARWIQRISRHDGVSPSDQEAICQVDRCFWSVMTRFLPGYEPLPLTTARLL